MVDRNRDVIGYEDWPVVDVWWFPRLERSIAAAQIFEIKGVSWMRSAGSWEPDKTFQGYKYCSVTEDYSCDK